MSQALIAVDASDLELKPGDWPKHLNLEVELSTKSMPDLGTGTVTFVGGEVVRDREGDVVRVEYRAVLVIHVVND